MSSKIIPRPHIGQFIDSLDPGGAEEVVINLSAELVARGYPVTIFHFGNPWLRAKLEERGLTGHELGLKHYKSIFTLPLFIMRLRKILKAHNVDILHAHLLGAMLAGSLAARLARLPAIGTIHDTYSLYEARRHPKYLWLASRMGMTLVAVADTMRREVLEVCSLNAGAVTRIYNGISLDKFSLATRDVAAGDEVQIVTVARAVGVKRLDLLLAVIADLDADHRYRLTLVGDGPLLEPLKTQARSLGIEDRVDFLGHRDDVNEILSRSDIYMLVSDSEGLSVSLLESMAAGLPSVVTDVGGNRELVADGETGWICSPGKTAKLAAKLTSLIDDRQRRRRFGLEARRRAEQQFSITAMADGYERLLSQSRVLRA